MAEKDDDADGTEAWGRRSHVRLEELPQADPIAYLGTKRHPVSIPPTTASIPPTTHDLEPSASMEQGAGAATKSHLSRRIAAAALGLAIILPMAVSLSSSDDVPNAPATRASIPPPRSPVEHARQNAQVVPTDLPPGGVTEAPLREAEPPLSSQQSVADWKRPASVPTAGDRSVPITQNPSTSEPAPSSDESAQSASTPRASDGQPPAVRAPAAQPARRGPTQVRSAAVARPFDFTAAMNAVSATSVGPVQCGPEAIGATAVAITFAPSGEATRAVIENGPLRGTQSGSCVARELRKVRIAPFAGGDAATVRTSVLLR